MQIQEVEDVATEDYGGWTVTGDPAQATRDVPFMNCCGMLFVPIPRYKALMSITPVRVCDYQSYCESKGIPYPDVDFPQALDHPAVNINWNEARAYCEWLTILEMDQGTLPPGLAYRLPTDLEWSSAMELPPEPQGTPRARSGKLEIYPWGHEFPPPVGFANYSRILGVDEFDETSPVGSFPPNALGFYDLAGNVWEWVSDVYDHGSKDRTARGASCFNDGDDYLNATYRDQQDPSRRRNNGGFRLALSTALQKDPRHRADINPWSSIG